VSVFVSGAWECLSQYIHDLIAATKIQLMHTTPSRTSNANVCFERLWNLQVSCQFH
jgi:hypothetical protein